jgi:hypothetical protein
MKVFKDSYDKGVALWIVVLTSVFVLMATFANSNELVTLLNGVFIGSLCSVAFAYWPLIWGALRGVGKYNDVRQMTLGFFLGWICVALLLTASIMGRVIGTNSTSSPDWLLLISVAGRYVGIIAAITQVTAPDFGLGLFHGRDRKVLFPALIIGLVVAWMVIYIQSDAFQYLDNVTN